MRILINTPHLSGDGGVINHYNGLKSFWSLDILYNEVGKRYNIPGSFFLLYDYIKFINLCAFGKYDVILLNPSLGKTAIKRDALFLRISKWFKIKTIVFFHGWSNDIVNDLNIESKAFTKSFNDADSLIVLAKAFKNDLLRWGITQPIHLLTTKVNDELLNGFDFSTKQWGPNILFLTRIETYKGIFITLEAFLSIKSKIPSASLTIAGNGTKLNLAKKFVLILLVFNTKIESSTISKFPQAALY